MSGRGGPIGQTNNVRVQLPLLERLIDDAPDRERDPPMAAAETMQHLRQSVPDRAERPLEHRPIGGLVEVDQHVAIAGHDVVIVRLVHEAVEAQVLVQAVGREDVQAHSAVRFGLAEQ